MDKITAPTDNGWMPIETVPQDGTVVLIRYADGSVVQCGCKVFQISREDRKKLAKIGIWPDYKKWRPTHWQPLPPAPRS